jgi:hypothetical protein
MTSYAVGPVTTIQRLKCEIEKLKRQQIEALKSAAFVRMTPAEATLYDDRIRRISELIQQLALREQGQ